MSNKHHIVDSVVCVTLTEVQDTFIVRVSGTDDLSYVARFEDKELDLNCMLKLVKVPSFNMVGATRCGLATE